MSDLPRDPNGGASPGMPANVGCPQIRPSETFVELHQNAFDISYPANWRAFGNEDSTVTIATAAGVAQGAIAFGVVIAPIPDKNSSPRERTMEDLIPNLRTLEPRPE
jgi:hypothetical protein